MDDVDGATKIGKASTQMRGPGARSGTKQEYTNNPKILPHSARTYHAPGAPGLPHSFLIGPPWGALVDGRLSC